MNDRAFETWLIATKRRCESAGIRMLSKDDPAFPSGLLSLPTCPSFVYVKGSLPKQKSVACIGTRSPTRFGAIAAKGIASALSEGGWSIVSGLAIGVDSICHRAALSSRGHTTAVLAHGLDIAVYPRENAGLAREILDAGGTLLSEYPPGTRAEKWSFVARDRLQAGLSLATFCMQTGIKGGSMHAVNASIGLKRPVYVPEVPERYRLEEKSAGILELMRRGVAKTIEGKASYPTMLSEISLLYAGEVSS